MHACADIGLAPTHACSLVAPSYGDAQLAALAAAAGEDEAAAAAASGGISSSSSEWDAIEVPQGLGLSSARLKWRQNLAYVEVFVALPRGTSGRQVRMHASDRQRARDVNMHVRGATHAWTACVA